MKLHILTLTFLSLLFQSCSMLPGSYNAGGYGVNYSSNRGPVVIELLDVSGNNLKLVVERLTFLRAFKSELTKQGRIILGDSDKLQLKININRTLTNTKQYKTIQHGLVVYHSDENYNTITTYTITDKAGFTAAKGTIRYNVLVRAKSGVDYDDARRVAIKSLFKAIAKRVANNISAKASALAAKYN